MARETDSTWLSDVRAPLSADGDTAHALVIHADSELRELLHVHLLSAGYAVTLAADGPEASRALGGRTPDLIVLDTTVSRLDGVQFIFGRPQARGEFIPLLFLTREEKVLERAQRLGVAACHTAPLASDRFLEAAARCVRCEPPPRFNAQLN